MNISANYRKTDGASVIDIMTEVTMPEYLKEILSIPVRESTKSYNGAAGGQGHSTRTRELGAYRARVLEEKRLKRQILAVTAALAKGRRPDGALRRAELRDLYLRLGRATLKRRRLERILNSIESPFVHKVVEQRYFTDLDRRLPTWSQTAREVGAAISGDELRRYVVEYLDRLAID